MPSTFLLPFHPLAGSSTNKFFPSRSIYHVYDDFVWIFSIGLFSLRLRIFVIFPFIQSYHIGNTGDFSFYSTIKRRIECLSSSSNGTSPRKINLNKRKQSFFFQQCCINKDFDKRYIISQDFLGKSNSFNFSEDCLNYHHYMLLFRRKILSI